MLRSPPLLPESSSNHPVWSTSNTSQFEAGFGPTDIPGSSSAGPSGTMLTSLPWKELLVTERSNSRGSIYSNTSSSDHDPNLINLDPHRIIPPGSHLTSRDSDNNGEAPKQYHQFDHNDLQQQQLSIPQSADYADGGEDSQHFACPVIGAQSENSVEIDYQ